MGSYGIDCYGSKYFSTKTVGKTTKRINARVISMTPRTIAAAA